MLDRADHLSIGLEWLVEKLADGIYLARCETDQLWLDRPELESVLPLLNVGITFQELLSSPISVSELKLRECLDSLYTQGILAINGIAGISAQEIAYRRLSGSDMREQPLCRVVSLDGEDISPLSASLGALGCRITEESRFRVVVARNYVDDRLDSINRECLRERAAWMLVRPHGRRHWIGPLFGGGRPGCWYCLAWWLNINGWSSNAIRADFAPATNLTLQMAAFAAAAWLGSGKSILAGSLAEFDCGTLSVRNHRLLARPGCPSCHAPAGPATSLPETVSPFTGITGSVDLVRSWPGLAVCSGQIGQTVGFQGSGAPYRFQRQSTFGVAESEERARIVCLAEGVERYSARFQGDERIVCATALQLGQRRITAAQLNFASQKQMIRSAGSQNGQMVIPRPPEDEERIGWFGCRLLPSGDTWFLPAGHVFIGYDPERFWADSNGVAAAETREEAAFRAFLELIERDAVSTWWYNRIQRPPLDLPALATLRIQAALSAAADCGKHVHILDLTGDFEVPVYVAVASGETPGLALGCAAHPDPEWCAWKALAGMNAILTRLESPVPGWTQWLAGSRIEEFPHLSAAGAPVGCSTGPVPSTLDALVSRARSLGMNVFMADLTRPELGLPVVRIVAPGMRPLKKRLAPGRLYDVPVKLGWISRPLAENDMNPTEYSF